MTDDLAAKVREHDAKMTPGEWRVKALEKGWPGWAVRMNDGKERHICSVKDLRDTSAADAEGIAFLRNNAPAIATALDAAARTAEAADALAEVMQAFLDQGDLMGFRTAFKEQRDALDAYRAARGGDEG